METREKEKREVTLHRIWGNERKVGGEFVTKKKSEAVIVGSLERRAGISIDYSKETDKAPLTAASSCFLQLCRHATPP